MNTYLLIPSYSRDGHTHILLIDSMGRLWRSNCYSKFRRLADAAVILDHAVTIGMSAIFFGHTNTLFPFMIRQDLLFIAVKKVS